MKSSPLYFRAFCRFVVLSFFPLFTQAAVEDFEYTITDNTVSITGYMGAGGSVAIPDTLEGLPVTSFGEAFRFANSGITHLIIPASVTSISLNIFKGDTRLESISVDEMNPVYMSVDGVLFNKDQTELIRCPAGKASSLYMIPNTVTVIGEFAFFLCQKIEEIEIPEGVVEIKEGGLFQCSSLYHLELPDSLRVIGSSAFRACFALKYIRFPEGITEIGMHVFGYYMTPRAIYIEGDAPAIDYSESFSIPFKEAAAVYYEAGRTGWREMFAGIRTEAVASLDYWGGYPWVMSNGHKTVDTFDFMGWLSLDEDSNWIYSYSLEQWTYLDEPLVGAQGAWAYLRK